MELLDRIMDHDLVGILAIAVLVAGLLVVPGPVWRVTGTGVTMVHELGHAVAGMLRGRTGMRVRVNRDHSGLTTSSGRTDTVAWTSFWGYPAPPLVGALTVCAVALGWTQPALIVVLVVFVGTLLFMRGWIAVMTAMLGIAGSGALLMWGTDQQTTVVLLVCGLFQWAGGIRAIANLSRLHVRRRSRQSDAAVLGRLTPLPAFVWILLFWLVALLPVALLVWAVRG